MSSTFSNLEIINQLNDIELFSTRDNMIVLKRVEDDNIISDLVDTTDNLFIYEIKLDNICIDIIRSTAEKKIKILDDYIDINKNELTDDFDTPQKLSFIKISNLLNIESGKFYLFSDKIILKNIMLFKSRYFCIFEYTEE